MYEQAEGLIMCMNLLRIIKPITAQVGIQTHVCVLNFFNLYIFRSDIFFPNQALILDLPLMM